MLVYIHGGFLHVGSGNKEPFSPSAQLAKDLNAVIVSFNYRLNVFGWMALQVSVLICLKLAKLWIRLVQCIIW